MPARRGRLRGDAAAVGVAAAVRTRRRVAGAGRSAAGPGSAAARVTRRAAARCAQSSRRPRASTPPGRPGRAGDAGCPRIAVGPGRAVGASGTGAAVRAGTHASAGQQGVDRADQRGSGRGHGEPPRHERAKIPSRAAERPIFCGPPRATRRRQIEAEGRDNSCLCRAAGNSIGAPMLGFAPDGRTGAAARGRLDRRTVRALLGRVRRPPARCGRYHPPAGDAPVAHRIRSRQSERRTRACLADSPRRPRRPGGLRAAERRSVRPRPPAPRARGRGRPRATGRRSGSPATFLRADYPRGSASPAVSVASGAPGGGAQFLGTRPGTPANHLFLRYRVRFAESFAFVKGGKLRDFTVAAK